MKKITTILLAVFSIAIAQVSEAMEKEWTRLGFTAKSERLGVSIAASQSNRVLTAANDRSDFQVMAGITRAYLSASPRVDLIEADSAKMQTLLEELSKKFLDEGASGISAPAFRSVDRFIHIKFPAELSDNNSGDTNYNYVLAEVIPAFGDRAAKPILAYAPQPGGSISATEAGDILGRNVLTIMNAKSYGEAQLLSDMQKIQVDVFRGFGDSMGITLAAFLGSVSSIAWTTLFAWNKNYEGNRAFVWGNYTMLGIPYSGVGVYALYFMNKHEENLKEELERLKGEYISKYGKDVPL